MEKHFDNWKIASVEKKKSILFSYCGLTVMWSSIVCSVPVSKMGIKMKSLLVSRLAFKKKITFLFIRNQLGLFGGFSVKHS